MSPACPLTGWQAALRAVGYPRSEFECPSPGPWGNDNEPARPTEDILFAGFCHFPQGHMPVGPCFPGYGCRQGVDETKDPPAYWGAEGEWGQWPDRETPDLRGQILNAPTQTRPHYSPHHGPHPCTVHRSRASCRLGTLRPGGHRSGLGSGPGRGVQLSGGAQLSGWGQRRTITSVSGWPVHLPTLRGLQVSDRLPFSQT